MARRKKARVWRAAEAKACVPGTVRTAGGRKRVVECAPTVEEAVEVHRDNEACACGVSYNDFRSGWTFTDAAEMLGARGGAQFRPSRRRVLSMMGKLKRDEWERHQEACAAPGARQDWSDVRSEDFLDGLGRVPEGVWWATVVGLGVVWGIEVFVIIAALRRAR